ncbi:MAG: hypothetical protein KJ063_13505 [Anaerolineae bacterium]|nr:hypothetical protein [Anaerolineae bacterium]
MKKSIPTRLGQANLTAKPPPSMLIANRQIQTNRSLTQFIGPAVPMLRQTTTRPQQQAALLQMQVQMGNAFVQRWLNDNRKNPIIQRQCPCQERDESEGECPTCSQRKIQRFTGIIQRENGSGEASYEHNWGRLERLSELRIAIEDETENSLQTRASLESIAETSSEEQIKLETDLNKSRLALIPLIEERVGLLKEEIGSLNSHLSVAEQVSSPDNDNATMMAELEKWKKELQQHLEHLRPLKMWHMRQQISDINEQLAAIEAELAPLGKIKGTPDPTTQLLLERKADLEKQKEQLAKALTADAVEYEQFDKRWGAKRYGVKEECGSIKSSGCGPTTLAIILNHLYREDPENLAAHGRMEIVTPEETATYAETNGRVCGNGTSGNTMVTNVPTQWPGFAGERLDIKQATSELRNGNLIIFLCRNCTGKKKRGGSKSYKGHFMVLSGVNGSGRKAVYDVLDPGANERADIATISYENLNSNNAGFWIVRRK